MMAMPLAALVVGFLAVYFLLPAVPARWADYVAVAVLAGLDALIGAVRTLLEGRFDRAILVSGFFTNMVIAALLAYLGDRLGVDLYLAVVVALGIRIFNNLGRIRALFVTTRLEAARARVTHSSQ
jgi:small basic protein